MVVVDATGETDVVQICVATDLSPAGRPVIERAIGWARASGGTVRLLHVVHDPELAPALSDDVPGAVADARAELQRIADAAPIACTVDVRTAEEVAAAIVSAAHDADYLFVGSQGKSGFERLRLGSVATAVLRSSGTPVVCCPPPTPTGN